MKIIKRLFYLKAVKVKTDDLWAAWPSLAPITGKAKDRLSTDHRLIVNHHLRVVTFHIGVVCHICAGPCGVVNYRVILVVDLGSGAVLQRPR